MNKISRRDFLRGSAAVVAMGMLPAAVQAEESVTLTYWSMWTESEPQAIAIQAIIDDYEASTGVTVNVEWKGRDITSLIAASLDAGETIDLYEDDFQRLSQTFGDYALDLSEMADAADYSSVSNAALVDAVTGWTGGSLACLLYQPYCSGIFYNKAIFDEVGVEEPTTWEEFLEVCQAIKDAGYTPLTIDDAYINLNLGYHLARYLGQDGVKELVNNGDWAENEAALKMAQDMQTLVESGYLSEYVPCAYPEGENEIGYGETAMIVNASWVPSEIQGNTDSELEWGMFSYPAVDGGVDGTEAMMVGGQGISVSANSANAQAAFDLAMAIVSGDGDAAISEACDTIPADPNNSEWPALLANCKAAFDAATTSYEWDCGIDDNADMTDTIKEYGAQLFSGSITAEEFIDALEAASN
ncbi:MAG: ABC transporter substrate-binding protein [Clostridiales bacterium]|nr:ABC transporter substrate-binding protein [Clostridiales bacterium]